MPAFRKWLVIGALALNAIGGVIILARLDLFLTVKLLYYFDFVVFPSALAWTVIAHHQWNPKGTKRPWKLLIYSALLFGVYIYATHIEPSNLKVRELTISMEGITRPITIAHLSDIQSDYVGSYEEEALQKVKSYHPDLIIHTGDLVQLPTGDERVQQLKVLKHIIQQVNFGKPIYNVFGDTDAFDEVAFTGLLAGDDMITLDDESLLLTINGQRITLTGLSLPVSRMPNTRFFSDAMIEAPEADVHIVMGHAPDYALHLNGDENILALAGHTHGGQVRLPWIGPLLTLSKVPRDWARGHTQIGNCHLNVSAGIGAEHAAGLPSIRFNCPPEFTIIYLRPLVPES